jgi:hypothetical protein
MIDSTQRAIHARAQPAEAGVREARPLRRARARSPLTFDPGCALPLPHLCELLEQRVSNALRLLLEARVRGRALLLDRLEHALCADAAAARAARALLRCKLLEELEREELVLLNLAFLD